MKKKNQELEVEYFLRHRNIRKRKTSWEMRRLERINVPLSEIREALN